MQKPSFSQSNVRAVSPRTGAPARPAAAADGRTPVVAEPLERRIVLSAPLLVSDGFEDGNTAGWVNSFDGGSVQVVGESVITPRAGNRVARFTLPQGAKRAEINQWPPEPKG